MHNPSLQTMAQLLRHAAERRRDGLAVRGGDMEISWRELERRALAAYRACIAAGLQPSEHAGENKGRRRLRTEKN